MEQSAASEQAGERRTVYFTNEEQETILTKYEEFSSIINSKSNTVAAARARKECWQKIADSLNATNQSGTKRTWEQVRNKYKNIIQSANRKKAEGKRTGGGPPPPDFTPAEELALCSHRGRPMMDGVVGGVSSDPCGSGSSHLRAELLRVEAGTVQLLPPPSHRLTSPEVDEETASACSARPQMDEEIPLSPRERATLPPSPRPRRAREPRNDNIRALYKRRLELDIELKQLLIKKTKLEVEKLLDEKKERDRRGPEN